MCAEIYMHGHIRKVVDLGFKSADLASGGVNYKYSFWQDKEDWSHYFRFIYF